jgi:hypothetical protein
MNVRSAAIALLLVGCGGSAAAPAAGVDCVSGSKELAFTFDANGAHMDDLDELVKASHAGVWSVHVALTMVSPVEMPPGDTVAAYFELTTGRIRWRELVDNSSFAPVPLSDGTVQDVAELVVPDVPADELAVSAHVQYNNTHDAAAVRVRIDVEACER